MDESGFGLLLVGGFEDDGSDRLDDSIDVADGRVTDVPIAMLTGPGGEFAFEDEVSDRVPPGDLLEYLSKAFERSEARRWGGRGSSPEEGRGFRIDGR